MAFKISDDGKQFTREQEGYIANAAPDAKTGRTAIGYGDNYADKSKPMSKEDAELRFQQRMTEAENDLGQAVTNPNLTQEQKDVMGDMHYNLGLGGMREFIDTVNSGDMTKAEQDILKYTKSFNTDTGQKEELPGLVKRVQARAARWANIKAQNPSLEEDELLKIADEVDAQDPESMNPDEQELLKIADEVDAEDLQMQDANTPGAREKGLDFAADIADSQIALKNSEARMISEKTGMAMDDAVALLEERTAPEILAQHAHSTTARYFPAVSQWAQDPDSYYFMRETGDWARKVELAATPLKEKKSDLSKLLDNTGIMHSRALTIAGMATGMLDVATGKRNLESLDEQQKLNQYADPGMQEVQKVMQDMGPEFVEALNLQKQAMTDVSEGNIWKAIQNAAKGSGVAADSVLGLMNTLRKNPTAAALVSAESMGSSLVPFASSMTGAASGLVVGAAGGPAGAATGAVALGTVGAFTSAFTLAFAERINDEIAQEFTDPETGKIDYDAAFADPAKVAQRRNEAAVYGLISGGFEAAYGMVAGKYLVKHAAAGAIKGQALKGVAVGLAKETAVESVGEGATEFVARSSADWFGGKLDSKKLAENAKEGVVEGIMSIGPGAALGTVGAGVRMVFKTPENSADATLKKAKEASQANEDLANLSNLRAAKDSHEASKTNPEQASTLIDAAVTPPPIPEDIHSPLDMDEKTVASESRAIDQAAESGTVAISPSEWDKYHTLNGTDPLKAMAVMSPEIQQEYARNRATDSSIRISHGEWLRLTSEDPHIDVIARVNGNALNAMEANEAVEGLEADPFTLFDKTEDTPPPAPAAPTYSKLEKTVLQKMGNAATPEQIKGFLKDVKQEERDWYGIDEFLAGKTKVTRAEIEAHMAAHAVDIQDVTKRPGPGPEGSKYQKFSIAQDGSNYREVLFTLPADKTSEATQARLDQLKESSGGDISKLTDAEYEEYASLMANKDYKSSHFDEKNILAHTRLNDAVDSEGNKLLLIEEIQSDWHQEGRKKGYEDGDGVPDAPLKKTWHEYVMKRVIREAVENGYDKVAWTTGEQQVQRFNLSKEISEVQHRRRSDGTVFIKILDKSGEDIVVGNYEDDKLEGLVGKDLAKKILAETTSTRQTVGGLDLKVGGEGMKGFYDGILVNFANKFIKKYGSKVEDSTTQGAFGFFEYTGPELTPDEIRNVIRKTPNESVRVHQQLEQAAKELEQKQDNDTFAYIMESNLSMWAAQLIGGKITEHKDDVKLHSFKLTPEMKKAAMNEGFSLFEKDGEGSDLNTDEPAQIIEADGPEGNLIMRPVELTAKFSRDAEKKIHSSIITRLKRSLKGVGDIAPEALEIFGDLEFQRLRTRAQVTGEDITTIAARLKIGKKTSESFNGSFDYFGRFSPYIVSFTKTASIKTVVHEFGHTWLQEMAEDWQVLSNIAPEALTDQQAEYKWAMEKAAELLGMGNIGELMNMDGERRTRIHETFAQTTEMYFLEGKFANSKVRALMETFRGWMTKIMHLVGQTYKQYPPLKITPEVERMFESIMGASAKVEQEVIPMFQAPLFDPAMLDTKKGEKYMNAVKMARSEAIGRAYTKVFNRGIRERETMINQERNRIFDAAVDEVNDLPEFRVLNSFKAAYEAFKNDKSGDDPRISYDSFLKLFGGDQARADAARALIPREMVAGKKKGGMDAAVFMHMNGMTNPDHMVRLLVDTGKYDEKVNAAFNKKIEEEFPVFKTDDEIHQVAVDALNAGGKAKLLLQEMNILMENFKPDLKALIEKGINPAKYIAPDAKKVMITEGTELVRSTNAVKFNANKFLVDSNRHGRDAARNFRANNIEDAFNSKRLEAIQFFAYEKARDAQELIAKTQKRIKNFVKYSVTKDLANEFDADVMEYGRQVIQAADAGLPIPEFITDNFSRHTGISSEMVHEVNESIVDFYKQSQGRVGKDLSVGGYIAFGELIKKIQNVAQRAKFVEIDGRQVGYDQATAAASTEITAVGNVVPFAGDSWGATTRRHFTNTRTLFDSLFNSSEDFSKSVMGSLFSGVVKAESIYNIEFAKYRQRMVKAIKNAGLKDTGKPIIGTELGVSFSNKAQLLMFALLYGSKSGQEKVLLGGFNGSGPLAGYNIETGDLDTSKADAMLLRLMNDGTLTHKDFIMLQEIWDINEEIHPLVKDAMRRSDGFNIGHIAGATFKTPWGDFRGGYVPVAVNKELLAPGPYESMLNLDTPGYMATGMYPSMNTGMTNERSKTYYDVDLDMSRLSSYLSASLRIAHLRNPLLDFGRVMESRDVRQALETKRPGAFKTVLVPWFNGVKNQEYTEFSPSWWDTLARKLRRNVNMATYIGNVASSLRQTLGLLPTISKVGVANVSLSAARFATSPKAMMERASNKSKYMENRMRSSQQDTIRSWEELETNFDWKAQTKEHTDKLTYFMIQATQNMVDVISWDAAYERGMDKGMTDAQAINFANGVVDATQSSSNVTSMTNAQRGTDIYKLFTMVSSVSISMHNLLRAESMRDAGTVARARTVITMGMVATIFPTLIDVFISENLADLVAGKEEEDEEKEAREEEKRNVAIMMKTAMGSLDTAIPVATRWIGGALMFGSASLSPAFSKLDRSASGGTNAVKNMYKGVDLSAREVGSLMDMMTIVSGVPFTMLGKGSKLNEALTDEESLNDQKDVRREQLADYREESKE